MTEPLEKILFVDDEPNVLKAYERQFRRRFALHCAEGSLAGLAALREHGPFAVVISDMRMPEMDGVEFLGQVQELAPDAVRMMLTGNADQQTAVAAVNKGKIFRFLNKPCPPEDFGRAIDEALAQFKLESVERELLSKTLSGSVGLLTEVLALVNPKAFGRSSQVRSLARRICEQLRISNSWEIEIAAMLCQVGCVTVPPSTLDKHLRKVPMSRDERKLIASHPEVGSRLVAKIPRLERVSKIIAMQSQRLDECDEGPQPNFAEFPLGARILKVALDYDALVQNGMNSSDALLELYEHDTWYDLDVLAALRNAFDLPAVAKSVTLDRLRDGMILDEHVTSETGGILVSLGQEVNATLRERLRSYVQTVGPIREPIRVRCPLGGDAPSDQSPVEAAASAPGEATVSQ